MLNTSDHEMYSLTVRSIVSGFTHVQNINKNLIQQEQKNPLSRDTICTNDQVGMPLLVPDMCVVGGYPHDCVL